ncbi:MAG: bifunctional [glutamate--ammonia ligase]-adenylyl-L-tyrosine phosphorylase/[glutamate--ammonia-ligase] adenylyltransferase [Proteobacteria bacterium]|nr:bifunctional [glutamate--ammonia ligase]-adenylyl-L-tyrosine phosphorylase/[glutamate--ammonia-ligase] adenylyltransferase [Pseudomonadota bacterium]
MPASAARDAPALTLAEALAWSRYATRLVTADPALGAWLEAQVATPFPWPPQLATLAALPDDTVAVALRKLRQRVLLHTLARDLTGRAPLGEVVATLSTFADHAVAVATGVTHRALVRTFGEPRGESDGAPQRLAVVALGKLGGRELNASSDIDIVLVYPEDGATDGSRSIANREFFDRQGRALASLLGDVTADGFVFRVDLRLRPYGESGPLTVTLAGLERYLVTQGRMWERYAWVKARPLTGDCEAELAALVTPFVYRKYLDYDAYEGLRDVHRQIREQAERRGRGDDVKLGRGGIREIEFIVQALQLVRGGRDPGMRQRGTRDALAAIAERELLPAPAVAALASAYDYLRRLEHRLQYRDDQQTQRLPADDGERAALAATMGAPDIATFDAQRLHFRDSVEQWFGMAFTDTVDDAASSAYAGVWDAPSAESHRELLAAAGYADPDNLLQTLRTMRQSPRYTALPAASRDRVDRLVPRLIATAAAVPGPSGAQSTLARLLTLLEAVWRRSAYLALLLEHPPLLPRLAQLMGASAWAAEYLTRHPLLLDDLLDAQTLLAPPDWDAWRTDLAAQLAAHADDAERQMDVLRHFKHAESFRLLVQDLAGELTVERLADHLSALADIVVGATVDACWAHLYAGACGAPRFCVVAYGKLGGRELGYASDLDLVFLYDVAPGDADEDGAPQRYARLAQRINNWLTQTTAAGGLYATDLRLRPDGAAGTFCTSLAAFRKYQRDSAWTWEHQALTRARAVAGDPGIAAAFDAVRDAILRTRRDPAQLAAEVVAMRARMHDGHPNRSELFDVKHDPGGMVDIEFVVQYLVLSHAAEHAALTRNAGNIALLLESAELGLVPGAAAVAVADAYRVYRRVQHAVRLTGATHVRVDPAPYARPRADVAALWTHVFGAPRAGTPVG